MHIQINFSPSVTSYSEIVYGNITSFILRSSTIMTTTLNLIHYGIADNQFNVPVQFFLSNTSGSSNSSVDLVLELLNFTTSFTYDPDISVTLASPESSNADLLPLLALTALVIPLVFIVLAVLGVTFVAAKWCVRRHRVHSAGVVAFNMRTGLEKTM